MAQGLVDTPGMGGVVVATLFLLSLVSYAGMLRWIALGQSPTRKVRRSPIDR